MPPHRFSKFGDYHLINRVAADSTRRFQRNLIMEIAETHRSTAAFSSKKQRSNTLDNNYTNTTSAPSSPRNHYPRTAGHTHSPAKPSTHQPTHPPYATAVQQQTDALVCTRTSPEQVGKAERTRYCTREHDSFTFHRHESTHPRTKRPPPTHPTTHAPTHPPTNQPTHQPPQAPCATVLQHYVQQQTETFGSSK